MLPVGVVLAAGALWVLAIGAKKTVHGVEHLGKKINCVVTGKQCAPKKTPQARDVEAGDAD